MPFRYHAFDMRLVAFVTETRFDPATIAAHAGRVHATVLHTSRHLRQPNFTRIHPTDLRLLFDATDEVVFGGRVRAHLGDTPLAFGLSKRMTSAGGKTIRRTDRGNGRHHYEIRVATSLLFDGFRDDDHRPITCSGLPCRDRLDALQRVMEHEMTHLIEWLLWDDSHCAHDRFQSITRRLFGHTEHTHRLITPRERAHVRFGVQPGSAVRFRCDGQNHTGIVNRVSRRATVLVEDRQGTPYSDGRRYAKFYVPLDALDVLR